ncbi:hypothetical protein J5N97_005760 [Dioscorea zingiberensis]|uniref:Uncharacterized protein n=1 Tax=Dioscorea zingiberensis TaxID=325984 RepID=A0A9D5D9L8_9LILI|nr:hypothetical protein J5N97_005760 [Dioscorea zingiberensis]
MEVELMEPKDVESSASSEDGVPAAPASLMRIILSSMVAAGVQYGWALQFALLTSYVQVLVIGFSSDIGYALGDTKEHCSVYTGKRWNATIVYVVGFWMLDFSNNTVLIVLGISSLLLEPMSRKLTTRIVWAISNFILFLAFTLMVIVSIWSTNNYSDDATKQVKVNGRVRVAALLIFAALGFPLSVIISLSAGPWDSLFHKGNLPAFSMASFFAFISSFVAYFILPKVADSGFSGFSASH